MKLLSWIVEWSLANRAVVLFATLVLAVIGAQSASRLAIDAVPDVTDVQGHGVSFEPAGGSRSSRA